MDYSSIDIFCRCIDNFGDVGVTFRFAAEFKAACPDCCVRVFVDNMEALHAIVSGIDRAKDVQEYESITYVNTLSLPSKKAAIDALGAADVMVEMFACHIPEPLLEMAYVRSKLIINLEYLSAEAWVEGYHLRESLLGRGGAIRKFYFMPGFRESTGGLIVNSLLEGARSGGGVDRAAVISGVVGGLGIRINADYNPLIGTIFTYERGFDTLVSDLVDFGRDTLLLVFGEKSHRGMAATLNRLGIGDDRQDQPVAYKNIRAVYAPFIDQHSYDTLLCLTDFNIVRGEDSLARAVLSGKPFIWNAYIQDERYQLVKVEALLETMRPYYADPDAFPAYRALMLDFNGAPAESPDQTTCERYGDFLKNLEKHERAASAMYYFMVRNCNLIAKFRDFLDNYTVPRLS